MSGTPNKKAEEARALFDQGMKLVDIAAKLGVPDGTVRRWKSTQNWDKKKSERSVKSERSQNKANARNETPKEKKKRGPDPEVKKLLRNDQLTDKQKMFCIYYVKYFNAAKAVIAAGYDTTKTNARKIGSALMRNPAIREEINILRFSKFDRAMFGPNDLFQMVLDVACADINDYVDFGREVVPVMGPNGPIMFKQEPMLKLVNSIKFKESGEVDGSLISEIKVGKDGASIKLQSKMDAIKWLSDRVDELPVEMRERLNLEKDKLNRKDTNDKRRIEIELIKIQASAPPADDDKTEDDRFLDAINDRAAELWEDGDGNDVE